MQKQFWSFLRLWQNTQQVYLPSEARINCFIKNIKKAEILNERFQSVFIDEDPLDIFTCCKFPSIMLTMEISLEDWAQDQQKEIQSDWTEPHKPCISTSENEVDIKNRMNKARGLTRVRRSIVSSRRTKLCLCQSCVLSSLHGSECWRMTETDLRPLSTWPRKWLRNIMLIFCPSDNIAKIALRWTPDKNEKEDG